ncbi:hypothetical protein C8F04DRAFT_504618 [Mycena alexandri]|uniref:Zn(2)-C6 fungal-type domain-containing protein n=1 Tax=Mycena alexandri TaxID=1745969 RepID=A0AAD6X1W0_9AGAR|nr:hypothetical protein C8F04DRAFT_504618 [Mycena alexandri]
MSTHGSPRAPLQVLTRRTRTVLACSACRSRHLSSSRVFVSLMPWVQCARTDETPSAPCDRCIRRGFACKYVPVAEQPPRSPTANIERRRRGTSMSPPSTPQQSKLKGILSPYEEYSNLILPVQPPHTPASPFSLPSPLSLLSNRDDKEPGYGANRPPHRTTYGKDTSMGYVSSLHRYMDPHDSGVGYRPSLSDMESAMSVSGPSAHNHSYYAGRDFQPPQGRLPSRFSSPDPTYFRRPSYP